VVNRQIGVRDFKYVGKICPYASVTSYGACAVAANAKVRRSKVKVIRSRNVSAAITL